MSTSAAPIGEALQSLEQLMKVFEGIADVSSDALTLDLDTRL
jgi:hypothetical protein